MSKVVCFLAGTVIGAVAVFVFGDIVINRYLDKVDDELGIPH